MGRPRLHLDADSSRKALHRALLDRSFDVTRTPSAWIPRDATDKEQLLGASAMGRIIFTFNIRDFQRLAQRYDEHHGILLAAQRQWTLSSLIHALSRVLSETDEAEWIGQVRWLNQWARQG